MGKKKKFCSVNHGGKKKREKRKNCGSQSTMMGQRQQFQKERERDNPKITPQFTRIYYHRYHYHHYYHHHNSLSDSVVVAQLKAAKCLRVVCSSTEWKTVSGFSLSLQIQFPLNLARDRPAIANSFLDFVSDNCQIELTAAAAAELQTLPSAIPLLLLAIFSLLSA